MVFVYIVIFSSIMQARLPGATDLGSYSYGIYLVAGILPWLAFQQTVLRCASVYSDKKSFLQKLPVALTVFPSVITISELVMVVITMVLFLVFYFVIGGFPSWSLLWVLPILVVQQIAAFALGTILASLFVFFRDLREIVGVVFLFWFWFTPIVYPSSILPEGIQSIMILNPAYWHVSAFQDIFVSGSSPPVIYLVVLAALAFVLALGALKWTRFIEREVRDVL
jgi:lipopolysaccharide transport system permease protein